MIQHLPSQFEVCRGATGFEIVKHDRPAVAWRFRDANVPWNDRVEDLPWEISVDLVADLEGEARTAVEHREHDPQQIESGVELLPNKLHGLPEQIGQPFQRVELALERDDNAISRDERVDREEAERRRAIDDDVVVRGRDRFEHVPESVLTPLDADQLDLGSDQVDVRRKHPQSGYDGHLDRLLGRFPAKEHVVDGGGGMETALLNSQSCSRIDMRIEVARVCRVVRFDETGRTVAFGGGHIVI